MSTAPSEWFLRRALERVYDHPSREVLAAAVEELEQLRESSAILTLGSLVTGARLDLMGKTSIDPGINADVERLRRLLEAVRWAEEVYRMTVTVSTVVEETLERCASAMDRDPGLAGVSVHVRGLAGAPRRARERCDREVAALLAGRDPGWLEGILKPTGEHAREGEAG